MSQQNTQDIGREKVAKIVATVLERVEEAEYISREVIRKEVHKLHELIEQMRSEIGSTGVTDVSGKHIPLATDELDAVVEATEHATSDIMNACESISATAEKLDGDNKAAILNDVTLIFEACSFQDITGQRINKVISNLKKIEEKVNSLITVLDNRIPGTNYVSEEDTREGDAKLMNGPQLPAAAVTQADIDKLLADLF